MTEEHAQVIAATNRIDILDPALLRSGRLDRKIEFPLPNESARARILEIHSRKMTVSSDVNYDELARSTDEFNAAQLKAVCVEAGMIALREGATQLGHEHFLSGIAEGETARLRGSAQLTNRSSEQEKEQSDVFCVVDDIDSKLRAAVRTRFSPSPMTMIKRVPVEIIARIFVQGAASDAGTPFLLRPHHTQPLGPLVPTLNFQILVSHVCQHWRTIALQTAELWTTLVFIEAPHHNRAQALLNRVFPAGPLPPHAQVPSTRTLTILISTVDQQSHTDGVTIAKHEMDAIFSMLRMYLPAWRALHLVVRDNICKGVARNHLGSCGPGPALETLQLYHFENFQEVQDLYLATYRPPVCVFSNDMPRLQNVSLIGVNLPWEKSPYLYDGRLKKLELSLHADKVRPSYEWWERMLRGCGSRMMDFASGKMVDQRQDDTCSLEDLALHYSGPKVGEGDERFLWKSVDDGRSCPRGPLRRKICMPRLERLSLTDLDPEYLCKILEALVLPALIRLELDLPEQDFTKFVDMLGDASTSLPNDDDSPTPPGTPVSHSGDDSSASSTAAPDSDIFPKIVSGTSPSDSDGDHHAVTDAPILALKHINGERTFPGLCKLVHLTVSALECSENSWRGFLRALTGLKTLNIDFARVNDDLWNVLMERDAASPAGEARLANPKLLPLLETFQMSGLDGEKVAEMIRWRSKPLDCGRFAVRKWLVRWSERMAGRDKLLDEIVENGVPITVQGKTAFAKITTYGGESDDDLYEDEDEDEEADDIDEEEADGEGEDDEDDEDEDE